MGKFRYRINSTEHSSKRFGDCEVCHTHATEVFYQVEEKEFNVGMVSTWTRHGCRDLYGHKKCLLKARRKR